MLDRELPECAWPEPKSGQGQVRRAQGRGGWERPVRKMGDEGREIAYSSVGPGTQGWVESR